MTLTWSKAPSPPGKPTGLQYGALIYLYLGMEKEAAEQLDYFLEYTAQLPTRPYPWLISQHRATAMLNFMEAYVRRGDHKSAIKLRPILDRAMRDMREQGLPAVFLDRMSAEYASACINCAIATGCLREVPAQYGLTPAQYRAGGRL